MHVLRRLVFAGIIALIVGIAPGQITTQSTCAWAPIWSPDGTQVLVRHGGQTTILDINDPVPWTVPDEFMSSSRVFDETGTQALIDDSLIDLTTQEIIHTFEAGSNPRFDFDGRYILTNQGLWSPAQRMLIVEAEGDERLFIPEDSPFAFVNYRDTGIVDFYDLREDDLQRMRIDTGITDQMVVQPVFDAESRRMTALVTTVVPGYVDLYDIDTGEWIARLDHLLPRVNRPIFIPGGNYLFTTSTTESGTRDFQVNVSVWDAETGALVSRLEDVRSPRFWREDSFVYVQIGDAGFPADVMLWQAGETVSLSTLAGVELRRPNIDMLFDGDSLLVVSFNTVYVWTEDDLLNRQPPTEVIEVGFSTAGGQINGDLTRLISYTEVPVEITPIPPAIDVTLWDITTGEPILTLMADRPDDDSFPTNDQINRFQELRSARFYGDFLQYTMGDVYVLHRALDGEQLVQSTVRPTVSPDGQTVAFINGNRVILVDVVTGEPRVLYAGLECS